MDLQPHYIIHNIYLYFFYLDSYIQYCKQICMMVSEIWLWEICFTVLAQHCYTDAWVTQLDERRAAL